MEFSFGKYRGKPVATVLFDHPDYFRWMKKEKMTHKKEYVFALDLIKKFNAMPFSHAKCSGKKSCENIPTYMTLYKGSYNDMAFYFCDECDPYSQGAVSGALSQVRTFEKAITVTGYRELLADMLRGKGLVPPRTKAKWKQFFGY